MKSVLISIRPEWVEKIVNGEKTIEVRKSAPKELPFKAYIYCTKDRKNLLPIEHGKVLQKVNFWENTDAYYGFGKVIGEFICDKIDEYPFHDGLTEFNSMGLPSRIYGSYLIFVDEYKSMCLSYDEVKDYGKGKTLYGWHISDLKIYDKPKELSEFKTPPCDKPEKACEKCKYLVVINTPDMYEVDCFVENGREISRPPQSYMFVEEVEEQNNNDN